MQLELDLNRRNKSSNTDNNLPHTALAVFKIYNDRTPNDLTTKLFHRTNTSVPFKGLFTKVLIGDNETGIVKHSECLVYYIFTDSVPPKIELDHVLYVYRKEIDQEEFDSIEYLNGYFVDGVREVRTLNPYWSKYMTDILNEFQAKL